MNTKTVDVERWIEERIRPKEIQKYLTSDGRDFIDEELICRILRENKIPDKQKVRDILAKSLEIKTLTLDETAELLHVADEDLLEEMRETALKVKLKVYDNRIVTFAPLYMGNRCVNNCFYCGFRYGNASAQRRVLTTDEIRKEIGVLAGKIGHKRLIVVYGEHPQTDIDYMVESVRTIYDVKVKTREGFGQIRRVNINAAPMPVDDVCPTFSKKDYFVSFTDKIIIAMGLSLLTPLFSFTAETVEKIWLFDKVALLLVIGLMAGFFLYAQVEAKRFRQCSSCQIGNNVGVIIKRVTVATILAIVGYLLLS